MWEEKGSPHHNQNQTWSEAARPGLVLLQAAQSSLIPTRGRLEQACNMLPIPGQQSHDPAGPHTQQQQDNHLADLQPCIDWSLLIPVH